MSEITRYQVCNALGAQNWRIVEINFGGFNLADTITEVHRLRPVDWAQDKYPPILAERHKEQMIAKNGKIALFIYNQLRGDKVTDKEQDDNYMKLIDSVLDQIDEVLPRDDESPVDRDGKPSTIAAARLIDLKRRLEREVESRVDGLEVERLDQLERDVASFHRRVARLEGLKITKMIERTDERLDTVSGRILNRLDAAEAKLKNVYEPEGATEAGRVFLIYPEYIQRLMQLEDWRRVTDNKIGAISTMVNEPMAAEAADEVATEVWKETAEHEIRRRLDDLESALGHLRGKWGRSIDQRLDKIELAPVVYAQKNAGSWLQAVETTIESMRVGIESAHAEIGFYRQDRAQIETISRALERLVVGLASHQAIATKTPIGFYKMVHELACLVEDMRVKVDMFLRQTADEDQPETG